MDESLLVDEFLEKEPIINEEIEELEEIYENKNIDSSKDDSTTESSESDSMNLNQRKKVMKRNQIVIL